MHIRFHQKDNGFRFFVQEVTFTEDYELLRGLIQHIHKTNYGVKVPFEDENIKKICDEANGRRVAVISIQQNLVNYDYCDSLKC
jgi:hypothetical protein